MTVPNALLILRNTGHDAEYTHDYRYVVDGKEYSRHGFLSLAKSIDTPDILF